jgi:hypothetical protein
MSIVKALLAAALTLLTAYSLIAVAVNLILPTAPAYPWIRFTVLFGRFGTNAENNAFDAVFFLILALLSWKWYGRTKRSKVG